jgi:hypothetical protein
MTSIEPTPLPAGMFERLDFSSALGYMNEGILAQGHGERKLLMAEMDACTSVIIDYFDDEGYTRLAMEVEPGVLRPVVRVHWTRFQPDIGDIEEVY